MKNAREVLTRMIVEANNVKNPKETREFMKDCADWLESIVTKEVKPVMVRVPFSWYFQAGCGNCGELLTTDEKYCEHCGQAIKWT